MANASGVVYVKEGETVVNEAGGKQSFIPERIDLIPAQCELLLAQCLGFGANKYGANNWQQIPFEDNINHAMVHIRKWQVGDRTEPHLVNALARLNFALWHAVNSGEQPLQYIHPDMGKLTPSNSTGLEGTEYRDSAEAAR